MREKSRNHTNEPKRVAECSVKSDLVPQSSRKVSDGLSQTTIWTIKITVVTFVLGAFFSFISELTSSIAHVGIAFILLVLLISVSIVCDAIGVAVTSCDVSAFTKAERENDKGDATAVKLVKNAEKVSNICCDVIGDICGIVSGACTVAIVMKLVSDATINYWVTICFSSVVGAFTVGGKAIFKNLALKNSKEIIMFVAKRIDALRKRN